MGNAVIVGYVRSPFTPANKGQLASVRPDDLAADIVKALIARTGVKPEEIEDILMGCAFPEGEQGFNIGRMVGLLAGLPVSVGGMTVNRWCGSSMEAIHIAAGNIATGKGEVFVAAGVESMTRIPMGGYNPLPNPKLFKDMPTAYISMGLTAENVAKQFKIGRKDQEAFALARTGKRRRRISRTRSFPSRPGTVSSIRTAPSAPIPRRRTWQSSIRPSTFTAR